MGSDELHQLARRQHGVASRAQALASLTSEQVRWQLTSHRWQRIHPGVYQLDTGPLSWHARASAGILYAGAGAVLSLHAAAYLHGFNRRQPAMIHLAIPHTRKVRRQPGLRIVRRHLSGRAHIRGLPITTAADTALDLAQVPGSSWREAISVCADALNATSMTPADLASALAARRTHRHRRSLEAELGTLSDGAQSGLEASFLRDVVRAHGLPDLNQQSPAFGADGQPIRRDFEHLDSGVIVEVDGQLGHVGSGRLADLRRDRRAAREGKVTLRAAWTDVMHEPCDLAADVLGALASRGVALQARPCGSRCRLKAQWAS